MIYIIIIVLIVCYIWFYTKYSKTVYRFYRPDCKHCVSSQAEWDVFKYKCLMYAINTVDVNLNDLSISDKALVDRYKITSVPTIGIISGDKMLIYSGDRTSDLILEWARDN